MAYDTVGTNVTPDGFNKPNLVEARWTASTTEFVNATPNSGNLRIEFNSVGFLGAQGGASLGVMLQNLLHRWIGHRRQQHLCERCDRDQFNIEAGSRRVAYRARKSCG
jgi:hypothetical protein